jgi:hypothetical protein
MLKKILTILAFAIVTFAIIVAIQPSEFQVTRTAIMRVAPSAIFPHINNFHNWDAWSPWAKLDPNAKNTFEGPTEGVGAALSWDGNKEVGKGKMTIMESVPDNLIRIKLDFIKPFEATSTSEFKFYREDEQTVVTWTMSGKNDFIGKAIGLFMDCDKMIGGQFEKGLENLKLISEGKSKK